MLCNMELLNLVFPEHLTVQKTGSIQQPGITRWPEAVTACYNWQWGYIVQQMYSPNGLGFCSIQVTLEKPLHLQIIHTHAASYLLYTTTGSATYMHNGYKLLQLVPNSYVPVYLTTGSISIFIQPGTYHFIFQLLSLPALLHVTDIQLPAGYTGTRLRITNTIEELITDIYTWKHNTTNRYIQFQKNYNKLLYHYNLQLQQAQQPGYITNPAAYVTEMEIYIADNIWYPEKITLQIITNFFKIEKRSVERYFLAVTKMSFRKFIYNNKMQVALCLLQKDSANIKEVAYQLGYSMPQNLTISFIKFFKFKPAAAKKYFYHF